MQLLCSCGECYRCKNRRWQAEQRARRRAGTIRTGQPGRRRKCNCGCCRLCRMREAMYRYLERCGKLPTQVNLPNDYVPDEKDSFPDVDEAKMNAYWNKVKTV